MAAEAILDGEAEALTRKAIELALNGEEIEAKVRSPRYWTYIVRHPDGFVVAYGRGRSRKTCERNAVKSAEASALEIFWRTDTWWLGRWRFVLWPPEQAKNP